MRWSVHVEGMGMWGLGICFSDFILSSFTVPLLRDQAQPPGTSLMIILSFWTGRWFPRQFPFGESHWTSVRTEVTSREFLVTGKYILRLLLFAVGRFNSSALHTKILKCYRLSWLGLLDVGLVDRDYLPKKLPRTIRLKIPWSCISWGVENKKYKVMGENGQKIQNCHHKRAFRVLTYQTFNCLCWWCDTLSQKHDWNTKKKSKVLEN